MSDSGLALQKSNSSRSCAAKPTITICSSTPRALPVMAGARYVDVFKVVNSKERDQVVEVVNQEDVSLGMVDPSTGR